MIAAYDALYASCRRSSREYPELRTAELAAQRVGAVPLEASTQDVTSSRCLAGECGNEEELLAWETSATAALEARGPATCNRRTILEPGPDSMGSPSPSRS